MTISVRDHKGEPLPNVQLDWWQADSQGQYYYRSYGLRGKVTTDNNGNAEVLTIAPGRYGRGDILRAAHIHLMFSIREWSFFITTADLKQVCSQKMSVLQATAGWGGRVCLVAWLRSW